MLLDTVATVILAGMMLIPLVNIFVGIIVGAWFAGLPGGLLGLALAIAVTAAEKLVGGAARVVRCRLRERHCPRHATDPPVLGGASGA